jgi:hypothetical protein
MNVGKIDCGAWLTLQALDEQIGEIRLRVKPLPSDFKMPETTDVRVICGVLGQFIVDWDIESDGVAVPCNDETKAKYLEYLIRLQVKSEKDGEPEFAIAQVMEFAVDINNFLKN